MDGMPGDIMENVGPQCRLKTDEQAAVIGQLNPHEDSSAESSMSSKMLPVRGPCCCWFNTVLSPGGVRRRRDRERL